MNVRPTALALLLASTTTAAADRVAVMSAFEPEWIALRDAVANPETRTINGNRFVTGTLEGQEVVLFLSGISMVNATMTTQLALDHFDIEAIVFSGLPAGSTRHSRSATSWCRRNGAATSMPSSRGKRRRAMRSRPG
nr:hypothetical protein [uncultured Jannaschia sp.]